MDKHRLLSGLMCLTTQFMAVSWVSPPCPAFCRDWTQEEILSGHRAGLQAIEQVSLKLDIMTEYFARGRQVSQPATKQTSWRWAKSAEYERMRYSDGLPRDDTGHLQGVYDWFLTPTETRRMINAEPGQLRLEPGEYRWVRASIQPRIISAPGRDASRLLLWTFALDIADQRLTLNELITESPHVEFDGPAIIRGISGWRLHADHPESVSTRKGCTYEILIDPAKQFAVVAVVEHHGQLQKAVDGKIEDYQLTITRVVDEFHEFEDGINIPKTLRAYQESTLSDRRQVIDHIAVSDVSINESVPPAEFDFRFPENAVVTVDPPEHPDRRKVLIWGPNNEVARELEDLSDMPLAPVPDDFASGRSLTPGQKSAAGWSSPTWVLFGNLVAITAIAAILIVRSRRRT